MYSQFYYNIAVFLRQSRQMLLPYSYDNPGRCYRRILTTIPADAIAVFLRQSRQMLSPYSYDNPG